MTYRLINFSNSITEPSLIVIIDLSTLRRSGCHAPSSGADPGGGGG